VNEVHPGTYADLKDSPFGQRDEALTNVPDGLRVSQHGHKMGIDMISVEGHRQISSSPCLAQAYDYRESINTDASIDMDAQTHWENIYSQKATDAVSWYRPHLEKSLELIEHAAPGRSASIIDVGGGESTLVDDLVAHGYRNITVLDISQIAIDVTKKRLASASENIHWLVDDITRAKLEPCSYDVWHDRAVFHFLTAIDARMAYVRKVAKAVKPGGHVIVSTFGPEGPTKCSGLDVVRYDAESLHQEFGVRFHLLGSSTELHRTPFGTIQQFLYCLCRVE
jgi:2-polyprenyl-3-methyl-5-hydroxy-6-metoxy-1,4-benzoquinol methylase